MSDKHTYVIGVLGIAKGFSDTGKRFVWRVGSMGHNILRCVSRCKRTCSCAWMSLRAVNGDNAAEASICILFSSSCSCSVRARSLYRFVKLHSFGEELRFDPPVHVMSVLARAV